MKVIAFNGSPKANGNTAFALKAVTERLGEAGIHAELVHVGNKPIRGCIACGVCGEMQNNQCAIKNDNVNEWILKAKEADGFLFGSPVHFSGMSGTMKSFLDRLFYVSASNGNFFRHKVGAAVVAVRRSGGVATFDSINHYMFFAEMLIPGSSYWNVIHGRVPDESAQDGEGIHTMHTLGNNMAWLMKLVESGKNTVPKPDKEEKVWTSFIR